MKHVIIGTAGHVDHGKTTLIQALTGTNPDRLKEEQERGMTIDLGFAALKLPDGTVAGIVDVPGHERFLKNMLAGAGGVDVVLFVIAADESVMPQTREHLDILRLLDVKHGVIALTKIDLVDKEWTDAVEEDVRSQLEGTFLASAPMIRVSAATRKGIEALKKELLSSVSRCEAKNSSLPFRLPIDRVFTRPGFGVVVTGTLVAGTLRIGDSVEIAPQKISARIRGLQIHGEKVSEAEAGSRVAANLAGIETADIERGCQIVTPSSKAITQHFDAALRLLPKIPRAIKDRARVRVHIGTAEIMGRVRILDERTELLPGSNAYIQFRADEEFACFRGDRFVIRASSPITTIGGGVVLDTQPARHRKALASTLSSLAAKERGAPDDLVETTLLGYPIGMLRKELMERIGIASGEITTAIDSLLSSGAIIILSGDRLIHASILQSLSDRVTNTLADYHQKYPLRSGIPKEELRAALGRNMEGRAFASLLAFLQAKNVVRSDSTTVHLHEFEVSLNERQESLLLRIEETYKATGIAVPTIEEVSDAVRAPEDAVTALLRVGVEKGRFHRISDGAFYHTETITTLKNLVSEHIKLNGKITVGEFRDLTESNRKFSLLALEYFDLIRFTRRTGDERTLFDV